MNVNNFLLFNNSAGRVLVAEGATERRARSTRPQGEAAAVQRRARGGASAGPRQWPAVVVALPVTAEVATAEVRQGSWRGGGG